MEGMVHRGISGIRRKKRSYGMEIRIPKASGVGELRFWQAQAVLTVQGVCIHGSPSICMGRVFVVLWEAKADWWRFL